MYKNLPYILLLLLVILMGITFFLFAQRTPDISDTIGYIYAAERLAEGHGLTYEDLHNAMSESYFSMYAFQIRRPPDLRMYLGFPPGFPLLLALGLWLTGQATVVHFVVPFLAVIGLVAAFVLGRLVTDDAWVGVWTAVLLALSPAYWQFGTAAWSEIPAMVCITGGVIFYLLSRQERLPLWQQFLFSIIGAGLLGYSLFIRYANITFFVAVGLYELATAYKKLLIEWERWPFFILLATSVGAVLLFNQVYYGGPTLTSYNPAHGWYPQPAFSLAYALGPSFVNGYSLREGLETLWANFPVLLLLVPVGWWFLKRQYAILIAAATIGTIALYSVYAFAPAKINARFLLPIFPFVSIAIAQALVTLTRKLPNPTWHWVGGIVLLFLLLLPVPDQTDDLQMRNQQSAEMVNRIQNMTAFSSADAVFMSYTFNDPIAYYGDRSVLNYRRIPPSDAAAGIYLLDWLEPCLTFTVDQLLAADTPVYYIEDTSPPFWGSLEILQTHFQLELVKEGPKIYQVQAAQERERPFSCPP
ncbi:MAG: hypothetical protein GY796_36900 [Chloroflexi bacterium]|nr:hypothetical protein [Chloroflexota bacterium]